MKKAEYSRSDMEKALEKVGIQQGDIVFSLSNISYFGLPAGGLFEKNIIATILEPILERIGPMGTFIVPTFTYSFTKKEIFDPDSTPSTCGILSEMVRKHPQSYRSDDPIFSVAAIGARAKELTRNVPIECFGPGSFWDRFYKADGIVLNLNFGVPVTFFHYVEKCLNVPYRYDKLFTGLIRQKNTLIEAEAVYFCRDMSNEVFDTDWMGIQELAMKNKVATAADVGRGYITRAEATDLFNLIAKTLKTEPFFLTRARNLSTYPAISKINRQFPVRMIMNAGVTEVFGMLKRLPRDIVSDGFDAALNIIRGHLPMRIYEYPTGSKMGSWLVPEKWTCYDYYLENMDQQKILSSHDDIAGIAAYSKSFEDIVPREEMLKRIWVDPNNAELTPVKYLNYQKDWGLCGKQTMKNALSDNVYRVLIDSEFGYGTLKIGEIEILGGQDKAIVFCVHLGDQAYAYDGAFAAAVMQEVFRRLKNRKNLKYTYRLFIVPQNFVMGLYFSRYPEFITTVDSMIFIDEVYTDKVREEYKCRESLTGIKHVVLPLSKEPHFTFTQNEFSRAIKRVFKMIDLWELK